MRYSCASLLAALALALSATARANDFDLQIITPHHEDIQKEFQAAFSAHLGKKLNIRWIKQGTGELLQLLDAKDRASKGESFGIDVFFGGGAPDHQLAADRGYTEPPNIPAEILSGIPSEIAGVKLYDEKHHWFGAALASFGVIYNKRGLATQKLPEIARWEDLADPRMYSWVIVADPRKSSSVRVSYELILQKFGWEKGWPIIMQMVANARSIAVASSNVPNDVAGGDVLAGPCIDFYASVQMARAGKDVIGYVNPVGGSAITPDPISMLRKPPNRDMAEKFIAFVLSFEGQRLWVLPAKSEGGPRNTELRRFPVRRDVCLKHADTIIVNDPFAEAEAGTFMKMDDVLQARRNVLVRDLVGVALIDLHTDLRAAWKALIDGGMKPAALEEWNKPPFTEAESLELADKLSAGGAEAKRITRSWVNTFSAKYKRVIELSK